MKKFRRKPHVKPGMLAVYYGSLKNEAPNGDVIIHNEAPARRADSHYIHSALNSERYDHHGKPKLSIVQELVSRGYDITSLRFSIEMLPSLPEAAE